MLTWNLRLVKWDQNEQWLPYLGLWVIAFVVWRVLAARALVERLGEAFMLAATSQLQIGASCRTLPCRVPSTPPPAAARRRTGLRGLGREITRAAARCAPQGQPRRASGMSTARWRRGADSDGTFRAER